MKEFKHISERESELFNQAFIDLATGHHLIFYRSIEQRTLMNEMFKALDEQFNGNDLTERQKEIIEWKNVCEDYHYAKKHGYINNFGQMKKIKWNDTEG